MKAHELRIDNFVQTTNEILTVESLDSLTDEINKPENEWESGIKLNRVFGIEITEEWLLKFGFERFPWGLAKGGLLFRDKNHECKELTLEVGNGFRTTVIYVHQLQNLYFALTGEELLTE